MTERVLHELPDVRGSFQIVRRHRRPPRGSRIKRKLARVRIARLAPLHRSCTPTAPPGSRSSSPRRRRNPSMSFSRKTQSPPSVAPSRSGGVRIPPSARLGSRATAAVGRRRRRSPRRPWSCSRGCLSPRRLGCAVARSPRVRTSRRFKRQVLARSEPWLCTRTGWAQGEDLAADAPFRGVHGEQADVTADVDHGVPRAERYPVAHVAVLLEYLAVEDWTSGGEM